MLRPRVRDLALYVPVVLSAYALASGSVHVLTHAQPRPPFWAAVGASALVGWFVPIVFAPAALLLVGLAAWLPDRWSRGARRALLLGAAPLLFAGAMGAGALATSGNTTVLRWPYVATVVIPALAYAALVHLPDP